MPQSAVRTHLDVTLDIHRDFFAQVSFYRAFLFENLADLVDFIFAQVPDLLVEIDPRPYEAQLKQAEGTLARDRATLQQARLNLKRYQEAIEENAVSAQTVSDQQAAVQQDPFAYYVDSLFRSDHPDANASDEDVRAETTRILAEGIKSGNVPGADKT